MVLDSQNGLIYIYSPISIVYPDEEDELRPKLKRIDLEQAMLEIFKDNKASEFYLQKKLNFSYFKSSDIMDILKENHLLGEKEHLHYIPLLTAEELIKQYA